MAGDQIHVSERGSGQPVLLLHGLMAIGEMFRWLAEPLEAHFRLIIPDLPGHGRSGAVPGPYTIEAMASRLASTLDSRGIRNAHVLGYSHGGTVAQQLARDAKPLVRSLALVATYAHNTASTREKIEGWLAPHLVRLLGMRRFASLIARPGTGGGAPMTGEQITWLRAMLAGNNTERMAQASAGLSAFDARPWLSQLHVPALVISGEHDTAVPAHHATMLTHGIAGAQAEVIKGAGHTMIWTHPAQLAHALTTFWNKAAA